jgi:hypothetical protein
LGRVGHSIEQAGSDFELPDCADNSDVADQAKERFKNFCENGGCAV